MKLINWYCPLLILCFINNIDAQTFGSYVKAGDKAFEEKAFYMAAKYYEEALNINKRATNIIYQCAESYRLSGSLTLASKWYKRLGAFPDKKNHPFYYLHYGVVLKQLGFYPKAEKSLKKYLKYESKKASDSSLKYAQQQLKACRLFKSLSKLNTSIEIEHFNEAINTPYSEFAPFIWGDSLLFSSLRFTKKEDKSTFISKIMYYHSSEKKARTWRGGFNSNKEHTANSKGVYGKDLYFTRCTDINYMEKHCTIYKKTWLGTRWGKAERLPVSINEPNSSNTHPCVAFNDSLQKDVLYFVSNRAGGYGGKDIWFSIIDDKIYTEPENIGQNINTIGDDLSPFFDPKRQKLYFSSDWHLGLGGLDVFETHLTDTGWAKPQNLGLPINSGYNDVYFIRGKDSLGYLASNRFGSLSLHAENCCYDLYKIKFPFSKPIPSIEIDTLSITINQPNKSEKPITTNTFEIIEKLLPLPLFFHNDEPDPKTIRSRTQKTYSETFSAYYPLKETYKRVFALPLSAEASTIAKANIDVFFEDKVRYGHEQLIRFSGLLYERLLAGDTVQVYLKGYTSPRATSDYNESLARRRITSVKNHFSTYNNGVLKPFMLKGQLELLELPFGETKAATGVSDKLNDLRNSIYSVDAALERRVEIVEIKRNREK